MADPMAIIEELQALAAEFGLTLKGPGVKAATRAAATGTTAAAAGDVAAARALIAEKLSESGITGVRAARPGLAGVTGAGVAGVASQFAKGAMGLAGLTFVGSLASDWAGSVRERRQSVADLHEALDDPWALEEAYAEDFVEKQTAMKIEAARMRKLQELAMMNPQLLANMRSKATEDSIPALGPGEARIGGSAWYDPEVIDKALANSDIWED